MNSDSFASRLRRSAVQVLAALYMVGLGMWVVAAWSIRAEAILPRVRSEWMPPTLSVALWFMDPATWMTLAFTFSVPLAFYCATSRATAWVLVAASCGLFLLSGCLVGTPYYIESFGLIQTAPNGSTSWSRYDFPEAPACAVMILTPAALALLAPHAHHTPDDSPATDASHG